VIEAKADESVPSDGGDLFTIYEQIFEYPSGQEAMLTYLATKIQYPEDTFKEGIVGQVYISFSVEKDGAMSEVKFLRGVSVSIDAEAVRAECEMPIWNSGMQWGKL